MSGTGKLSKQLKYRDEVSERKVNVNWLVNHDSMPLW